jgi:hypothetical protein
MVRFELVAFDYKWCSEVERSERDRVVIDMAKEICTRYLNGDLDNSLYLMVSFFSPSVYSEFVEHLEVTGLKGLCKVETGADRVIRITFEPEESPLWTKRAAHFE